MAIELVVEDGTGLADANTYQSLEDLDSYHTIRGNEAWTDEGDDDIRAAAAIRATQALDSWLRGRWNGSKLTAAQSLAWPREEAVDEDGFEIADDIVPTQVEWAHAEIALIELLAPNTFLSTSQSKADAVSSETVGPISVTYKTTAPSVTTYPHIEALLSGLASVGGTTFDMLIGVTEREQDAIDAVYTEPDPYLQLRLWSEEE